MAKYKYTLSFLGENETIKTSPEVSFREALEYFRSSNTLDQHMSHIKPTVQHNGCSAFSNFLFGPPKMKRQLNNERCLVFALALCVFNNDEEIHNNVLQTIYKRLAGTKLDCPRYGNHWQVIGFQGKVMPFIYDSLLQQLLIVANNDQNRHFPILVIFKDLRL